MRIHAILAAPLFLSSFVLAQASPIFDHRPPLDLGTAWYPEQWPESRWEDDLALMQQAHVHFVRVGEFAWSRMEPSEGHYDLDWLDHAIRAAEKHRIAVVLGTPSAAPPAWLTSKYPETLRTLESGRMDAHGNRAQGNWTDPRYRELCRKIAEQMALRFGHDPDVIGWQLDNEISSESYDAYTRTLFQDWLHQRYGTLENLNARWTTSYWSQTYSDWSQLPIELTPGNPGLLLAWREFASDTWRSYLRNQIDVMRPHLDARQFITTNTMGWFDGYDHYVTSQDLDLAAWDDYVGTGQLDPVRNGAAHDLTRGFLRKNFWVMETQPGSVNWSKDNNVLNKGEVRAMAWHDVGHGADAVAYWQWRSALNGQEEYHGTLVGADGTPVPLYEEVAQLGAEFDKAGPALRGTEPHAEVAILHSFESRWAIDWQRHNQAFDPVDALLSFYGPVRALVHTVDVVPPGADLRQYKLVVAPAMNVLSDTEAKNLIAYVQNGGHLVLGQRSGMKNADNGLSPERQPGLLANMLGGRVEQFYALTSNVPISGEWGTGTSQIWAEQLSVKDPSAHVLMRYGISNGWLDGQPAAMTRAIGKGRITYIGAWLDNTTMAAAAKWMVADSGIQTLPITLPDGVDLYIRSSGPATAGQLPDRTVWILVNFGNSAASVTLPSPMHDVLAGRGEVSRVELARYGVAVVSTQ